MNQDEFDTAKLHSESLQLRNQQFQLGTLALAGSGLSAWLAPGLTAITEKEIPQAALVAGSVFWILLLALLYGWSLALRRIIVIISEYLDQNKLSNWEPAFREFQKRSPSSYSSQTWFVTLAFQLYGVVATGGSIIAAWCSDRVHLESSGHLILFVALASYLLFINRIRRHSKVMDVKIAEVWRKRLAAKGAGAAENLSRMCPECVNRVATGAANSPDGRVAEGQDPPVASN